jgi:hypothetical protein
LPSTLFFSSLSALKLTLLLSMHTHLDAHYSLPGELHSLFAALSSRTGLSSSRSSLSGQTVVSGQTEGGDIERSRSSSGGGGGGGGGGDSSNRDLSNHPDVLSLIETRLV